MKKSIILLILIFVFFCITPLVAQITDPGDDPVTEGGMPIDGGLTLLLAAGAIYGAKKVKDSRNK
jgi:hypothetical protein